MSNDDTFSHLAAGLIRTFSETRPIHANTLLLSVYGDTVCPHGGTIWLGSLIKLVEPLGIQQRLVRTSVFRLSDKGILQSRQVGRRSYYTLTERGLRQFSSASKRIYSRSTPQWDGSWRLVMTSLSDLAQEERDTVRKELHWLGFQRIVSGVFAHPNADTEVVEKMIDDLGFTDRVVILKANASSPDRVPVANTLITRCFDVSALDEEYQQFIDTFEPILKAAAQAEQLDPETCFLVRTLLIHRFRHILLKEPELPDELLPEDALSYCARRVTESLYQLISKQADVHFMAVAECEQGAFGAPREDYYQRFLGEMAYIVSDNLKYGG